VCPPARGLGDGVGGSTDCVAAVALMHVLAGAVVDVVVIAVSVVVAVAFDGAVFHVLAHCGLFLRFSHACIPESQVPNWHTAHMRR